VAERAQTVIVLTAGKPVEVTESVEEVKARIAGAQNGFFEVVDTRGNKHFVNVNQTADVKSSDYS